MYVIPRWQDFFTGACTGWDFFISSLEASGQAVGLSRTSGQVAGTSSLEAGLEGSSVKNASFA